MKNTIQLDNKTALVLAAIFLKAGWDAYPLYPASTATLIALELIKVGINADGGAEYEITQRGRDVVTSYDFYKTLVAGGITYGSSPLLARAAQAAAKLPPVNLPFDLGKLTYDEKLLLRLAYRYGFKRLHKHYELNPLELAGALSLERAELETRRYSEALLSLRRYGLAMPADRMTSYTRANVMLTPAGVNVGFVLMVENDRKHDAPLTDDVMPAVKEHRAFVRGRLAINPERAARIGDGFMILTIEPYSRSALEREIERRRADLQCQMKHGSSKDVRYCRRALNAAIYALHEGDNFGG